MRQRRGIYLLPNLLTTANLFSGFYAVLATFNADYVLAAIAILIATIFDSVDGKAARMARATTRFGLEYDSLADVISFGIAPGLLVYTWALSAYGRIGWVAAFLYLACGAMRLARFNARQAAGPASHDFTGLPIPAAAGLLASLVLLDHHILRMGQEIRPGLILVLTYGLAFLMVSTIRYRSFKDFRLRDRKPFQALVTAVLVLALFAAAPQVMGFALFSSYAASGPLEPLVAAVGRRVFGRPPPAPETAEVFTEDDP